MVDISRLIRTPQTIGLGRKRVKVKRNLSPKFFSRRAQEAPAPLVPSVVEQYDVPEIVEGVGTPSLSQSPQGAVADIIADETAPIGHGLGRKGLSAAVKGTIGALAGASPAQIAGAIAKGQLSPAALASIANQYAGPAIGRQGLATAVGRVGKAFGTEDYGRAVDMARQDPVSRDINIGPQGVELGPGLTEEQQKASTALDVADVKNRHLDRPLTTIALQGVKNLAPKKLTGWAGFYQDPVAEDVLGISAEEMSFDDTFSDKDLDEIGVDPKTKETKGVTVGRGPIGTSPRGTKYDMTLDQLARMSPEMFQSMPGMGSNGGESGMGGNESVAGPTDDTVTGEIQSPPTGGMLGRGIYGGSAGGTFLCSELYRQGLMPDEIYKADAEYGKTVNQTVYKGYAVWARPLAEKMKTSKLLTALAKPIVNGWAQNMARRMGVQAKFSFWGAVAEVIGAPVCFLIGLTQKRKEIVAAIQNIQNVRLAEKKKRTAWGN